MRANGNAMKLLGVNVVKKLACAKAAVSSIYLLSVNDPTQRAKIGKIKIIDVQIFIGDLLANLTYPNWIAHNRPCSSY